LWNLSFAPDLSHLRAVFSPKITMGMKGRSQRSNPRFHVVLLQGHRHRDRHRAGNGKAVLLKRVVRGGLTTFS
jgi:hypothetical protein